MEINVYYPKRREARDYINDWDIKVSYNNQIPTKANIDKDYVELPIPQKFWNVMDDKLDIGSEEIILEGIFKMMNDYNSNPMSTNKMQDWIRANKVSHTSMSVGDVVCINDMYFVCMNEGWKEVQ